MNMCSITPSWIIAFWCYIQRSLRNQEVFITSIAALSAPGHAAITHMMDLFSTTDREWFSDLCVKICYKANRRENIRIYTHFFLVKTLIGTPRRPLPTGAGWLLFPAPHPCCSSTGTAASRNEVMALASSTTGGWDQPSHGKLLRELCWRVSCDATARSFPLYHQDQQQQQHYPELGGIPTEPPMGAWAWNHETPEQHWRGYCCKILAEGSSYFIPQIEPNKYFCSQTFRV